eukprot:gene1021-1296_t
MYAIVEIAGKQFKVTKDLYIYTPKIDQEAGSSVFFDQILLLQNDQNIQVGAPTIAGAKIEGKVVAHVKGDKF